jgi:hypothetical protein
MMNWGNCSEFNSFLLFPKYSRCDSYRFLAITQDDASADHARRSSWPARPVVPSARSRSAANRAPSQAAHGLGSATHRNQAPRGQRAAAIDPLYDCAEEFIKFSHFVLGRSNRAGDGRDRGPNADSWAVGELVLPGHSTHPRRPSRRKSVAYCGGRALPG